MERFLAARFTHLLPLCYPKNMNQYQYILFDWDGCLAKTLEVWLVAYRNALAHYGKYPTDREIGTYFGDRNLEKHFGIDDHEVFTKMFIDEATINLTEVELYDGAKDALTALKNTGHKLALISSSPRQVLDTSLSYNNLTTMFEIVISGEDVINHKPHPESLEKALGHLGGLKEKTIMIGDSTKDIGAANNFGVDSILIYHPSHDVFYERKVLEAESPTYIIEDFRGLPGIISKNPVYY